MAGTIPNGGRARAVTLPGSVLQRLLVNVLFTPSRLGAFCACPSLVLFWFLSAPVSYTGQYTDPVYSGEEFLGGGGSHSKQHFESVNVMGREKAITGVQSNLTKV